MRFIADYHVHSRFSDGQATLEENVEAALACKLRSVALTEHGPRHIVSGIKTNEIPSFLEAVDQLKKKHAAMIDVEAGIEANPVSFDGKIDVPKEFQDKFKVIGVGFHRSVLAKDLKSNAFIYVGRYICSRSARAETVTNLLIAAMERNTISYLSHPGQYTSPLEWKRLALSCREHNVAVEISARAGHLCFSPEDARMMRDCGAVFVVNSDAHKATEIGSFNSIDGFLQRAELTEQDIVNAKGFNRKRPKGLTIPEG